MVTDYWGEVPESTGNFEDNGFDPIPEGTECLSTIIEAKWDSFNGSDHQHINLKLQVVDGEYKNRTFYQSLYVDGADPSGQYYDASKDEKKKSKARAMMAAVDKNAGGNIFALRRRPTNDELQKYLIAATMIYTLGVYNNKQFVRGVAPNPNISEPSKQTNNTAKVSNSKPVIDDDKDLIPF